MYIYIVRRADPLVDHSVVNVRILALPYKWSASFVEILSSLKSRFTHRNVRYLYIYVSVCTHTHTHTYTYTHIYVYEEKMAIFYAFTRNYEIKHAIHEENFCYIVFLMPKSNYLKNLTISSWTFNACLVWNFKPTIYK